MEPLRWLLFDGEEVWFEPCFNPENQNLISYNQYKGTNELVDKK
jgi:hypothetical protein